MKRLLIIIGAKTGGEFVAGRRLVLAIQQQSEKKLNIDVVYKNELLTDRKEFGKGRFWINLWQDFISIKNRILKLSEGKSYDYVITSDYLVCLATVFALRKKNIKIHFWFHGLRSMPIYKITDIIPRQLAIKILEASAWMIADRVIVPDEQIRVYINKRTAFMVNRNSFLVLPNIIPDLFFKNIKDSPKNPAKPKIFYSGRMVRLKGLENLALAVENLAREFPDIELILACPIDGFDHELYESISNKYIHLMMDVLPEKLVNLYRKANITVLPSCLEFAPLAIGETLAAGGICMGTRTGNIGKLLEQIDPRLIFKTNTVDDIQFGIKQVLQISDKVKNSWRKKGQILVEKQRQDKIVKEFIRVYGS